MLTFLNSEIKPSPLFSYEFHKPLQPWITQRITPYKDFATPSPSKHFTPHNTLNHCGAQAELLKKIYADKQSKFEAAHRMNPAFQLSIST